MQRRQLETGQGSITYNGTPNNFPGSPFGTHLPTSGIGLRSTPSGLTSGRSSSPPAQDLSNSTYVQMFAGLRPRPRPTPAAAMQAPSWLPPGASLSKAAAAHRAHRAASAPYQRQRGQQMRNEKSPSDCQQRDARPCTSPTARWPTPPPNGRTSPSTDRYHSYGPANSTSTYAKAEAAYRMQQQQQPSRQQTRLGGASNYPPQGKLAVQSGSPHPGGNASGSHTKGPPGQLALSPYSQLIESVLEVGQDRNHTHTPSAQQIQAWAASSQAAYSPPFAERMLDYLGATPNEEEAALAAGNHTDQNKHSLTQQYARSAQPHYQQRYPRPQHPHHRHPHGDPHQSAEPASSPDPVAHMQSQQQQQLASAGVPQPRLAPWLLTDSYDPQSCDVTPRNDTPAPPQPSTEASKAAAAGDTDPSWNVDGLPSPVGALLANLEERRPAAYHSGQHQQHKQQQHQQQQQHHHQQQQQQQQQYPQQYQEEDWDGGARAIAAGIRMVQAPQPVYLHRPAAVLATTATQAWAGRVQSPDRIVHQQHQYPRSRIREAVSLPPEALDQCGQLKGGGNSGSLRLTTPACWMLSHGPVSPRHQVSGRPTSPSSARPPTTAAWVPPGIASPPASRNHRPPATASGSNMRRMHSQQRHAHGWQAGGSHGQQLTTAGGSGSGRFWPLNGLSSPTDYPSPSLTTQISCGAVFPVTPNSRNGAATDPWGRLESQTSAPLLHYANATAAAGAGGAQASVCIGSQGRQGPRVAGTPHPAAMRRQGSGGQSGAPQLPLIPSDWIDGLVELPTPPAPDHAQRTQRSTQRSPSGRSREAAASATRAGGGGGAATVSTTSRANSQGRGAQPPQLQRQPSANARGPQHPGSRQPTLQPPQPCSQEQQLAACLVQAQRSATVARMAAANTAISLTLQATSPRAVPVGAGAHGRHPSPKWACSPHVLQTSAAQQRARSPSPSHQVRGQHGNTGNGNLQQQQQTAARGAVGGGSTGQPRRNSGTVAGGTARRRPNQTTIAAAAAVVSDSRGTAAAATAAVATAGGGTVSYSTFDAVASAAAGQLLMDAVDQQMLAASPQVVGTGGAGMVGKQGAASAALGPAHAQPSLAKQPASAVPRAGVVVAAEATVQVGSRSNQWVAWEAQAAARSVGVARVQQRQHQGPVGGPGATAQLAQNNHKTPEQPGRKPNTWSGEDMGPATARMPAGVWVGGGAGSKQAPGGGGGGGGGGGRAPLEMTPRTETVMAFLERCQDDKGQEASSRPLDSFQFEPPSPYSPTCPPSKPGAPAGQWPHLQNTPYSVVTITPSSNAWRGPPPAAGPHPVRQQPPPLRLADHPALAQLLHRVLQAWRHRAVLQQLGSSLAAARGMRLAAQVLVAWRDTSRMLVTHRKAAWATVAWCRRCRVLRTYWAVLRRGGGIRHAANCSAAHKYGRSLISRAVRGWITVWAQQASVRVLLRHRANATARNCLLGWRQLAGESATLREASDATGFGYTFAASWPPPAGVREQLRTQQPEFEESGELQMLGVEDGGNSDSQSGDEGNSGPEPRSAWVGASIEAGIWAVAERWAAQGEAEEEEADAAAEAAAEEAAAAAAREDVLPGRESESRKQEESEEGPWWSLAYARDVHRVLRLRYCLRGWLELTDRAVQAMSHQRGLYRDVLHELLLEADMRDAADTIARHRYLAPALHAWRQLAAANAAADIPAEEESTPLKLTLSVTDAANAPPGALSPAVSNGVVLGARAAAAGQSVGVSAHPILSTHFSVLGGNPPPRGDCRTPSQAGAATAPGSVLAGAGAGISGWAADQGHWRPTSSLEVTPQGGRLPAPGVQLPPRVMAPVPAPAPSGRSTAVNSKVPGPGPASGSSSSSSLASGPRGPGTAQTVSGGICANSASLKSTSTAGGAATGNPVRNPPLPAAAVSRLASATTTASTAASPPLPSPPPNTSATPPGQRTPSNTPPSVQAAQLARAGVGGGALGNGSCGGAVIAGDGATVSPADTADPSSGREVLAGLAPSELIELLESDVAWYTEQFLNSPDSSRATSTTRRRGTGSGGGMGNGSVTELAPSRLGPGRGGAEGSMAGGEGGEAGGGGWAAGGRPWGTHTDRGPSWTGAGTMVEGGEEHGFAGGAVELVEESSYESMERSHITPVTSSNGRRAFPRAGHDGSSSEDGEDDGSPADPRYAYQEDRHRHHGGEAQGAPGEPLLLDNHVFLCDNPDNNEYDNDSDFDAPGLWHRQHGNPLYESEAGNGRRLRSSGGGNVEGAWTGVEWVRVGEPGSADLSTLGDGDGGDFDAGRVTAVAEVIIGEVLNGGEGGVAVGEEDEMGDEWAPMDEYGASPTNSEDGLPYKQYMALPGEAGVLRLRGDMWQPASARNA